MGLGKVHLPSVPDLHRTSTTKTTRSLSAEKHDSANDHPYWKRTCHGIYPRQVLHSQIYQSPEAPHKHHKKKYREEHRKELDQYQETLSFFREHSDGKVPSI